MKRYLIIICCLIASLFSWNILAATQNDTSNHTNNRSAFTPGQVKEIQKIIYNYLINNPEVLVKASQALEEKQTAEAQKNALAAIGTNRQQLFNDPATPTAGNPKGSVEIVEFFDYQCGHCKAMAPIVKAAVKNNTNIKVIFKELPIFGGNSRLAATAALASTKQSKYYAFHNALFAATAPLNEQTIFKIAKQVGLNVTKLKQDMKTSWISKQIRDNFQLAQELKLMGTPAFIISNKDHTEIRFIPGATSKNNFNQQIDAVSPQ